jgi:hypothetical protein
VMSRPEVVNTVRNRHPDGIGMRTYYECMAGR